jgi:phosphoglycolate phosphatase-like HAD superfamily hydrolase
VLPELVVTDFAGTAMKEDGAVLVAYRLALTDFDILFTEEDLAARRGASKREVFQELAARTREPAQANVVAEKALAAFDGALRREYESGPVREIDGAGAAVAALRAAGIKVALSSVYASDDAPAGRPAPYLIYHAMIDLGVHDVGRVAVVGDTPLDLQAGSNARAGWVIGVLSGAHGLETLGATPHTHLLPSISSLPMLFGIC